MANKIQFKRGPYGGSIGVLDHGEPAFAFTNGNYDFYIGTNNQNIVITRHPIVKADFNENGDTYDTPRAITAEFIQEEILDKIQEAQENVLIDGVTIKRENGAMYVNQINPEKVIGLLDALGDKVDKVGIAAGTAAKVTFNKDGLITGVGTLDVADIPLLPKSKIDGLETDLGEKATKTELTAHTQKTDNPHEVTQAQVGLGKVENKTSAEIRAEITEGDIPTLPQSRISGLETDLAAKATKTELTTAQSTLQGNINERLMAGLGVIRDLKVSDDGTYILSWKEEDGTAKSFDFPIEMMPVAITFDEEEKELVFTLDDESTVRVDIGHLVSDVVLKVNGQLPDGQGNVTLQIANIAGLADDLNSRALAANVYKKSETYSAAEVDIEIANAVIDGGTWNN